MGFRTPPPSFTTPVLVSFPTPQILLATLNNPQQMNCVTQQGHVELSQLFAWYDAEPTLRCAIITGTRASVHNIKRKDAFSAGADLKGALPRSPPLSSSTILLSHPFLHTHPLTRGVCM